MDRGIDLPVVQSNKLFYNKSNCKLEAEVKEGLVRAEHDGQDCSIEIEEVVGKGLSELEFASKVYEYLLRYEFKERVQKFCVGSAYKPSPQGLDFEELEEGLLNAHSAPAHLRVSVPRLYEACKVLSATFTPQKFVSYNTAIRVVTYANPRGVLTQPISNFEYEYLLLDIL